MFIEKDVRDDQNALLHVIERQHRVVNPETGKRRVRFRRVFFRQFFQHAHGIVAEIADDSSRKIGEFRIFHIAVLMDAGLKIAENVRGDGFFFLRRRDDDLLPVVANPFRRVAA